MEANIMKYIDSIDWEMKNQLGKVLEHYFYEKQHREYTSCIKDEREDYSPSCNLTKEAYRINCKFPCRSQCMCRVR